MFNIALYEFIYDDETIDIIIIAIVVVMKKDNVQHEPAASAHRILERHNGILEKSFRYRLFLKN